MRRWCLSACVRLSFLISLSGCVSVVAVSSAWTEGKPNQQDVEQRRITSAKIQQETGYRIPQLSEIKRPSTSAQMLVQSPAPTNPPSEADIIQVTGVEANPTEKGVEVILQTTQGEQLQITNRSTDNNFIADIPNAQLRLPSGDAFVFRSEKPVERIAEITVTNLDANTIRVTVAGEAGLPTVQLFDSVEGLIFGLTPATTATQPEPEQPTGETSPETPSAEADESIEVIVRGEQDTGYRVPDANVGTRTDTPLRDIPQSIQVVPQEVLRDQNVTRLDDALRNVPGVTQNTGIPGAVNRFVIRGFALEEGSNSFFRDGLPDRSRTSAELPNIERVEVLRGPASVLFGLGSPGGTINLVTKQPLREPFYAIDATIGSYDFYRGAIDISGPLNDSRAMLYRLNASYRNSGNFIDFFDSDYLVIAPVLSVDIGERTNLTFDGEYVSTSSGRYSGLPAIGSVQPNPNGQIPRSRNYGEPSSIIEQTISQFGYRLEHQFSDNWSFNNAFRASFNRYEDDITVPLSLAPDNRTLDRVIRVYDRPQINNTYILATNLTGRFSTGSIEHRLLVGVDLDVDYFNSIFSRGIAAPIDLFSPIYRQPLPSPPPRFRDQSITRNSLGIYLQDQVTLAENLNLLLGVRFDAFEQQIQDFLADTRTNQSGDAFSPRVGIVYQPIQPISLYASYARSFTPVIGTAFDDSLFQPERGTQYEIGVKADLNDRLSATLALYDLTRSNVLTDDPVNLGFSIQTGEQRSRGVELNVAGEILPGWNIIAGYAYTDARITKDTTFDEENRLNNVPENAFNLWTTYEIQRGALQGLGIGTGLFFVGERQGDLDNSFQVPSYLRTDAAIFYNRDRFRAALNFKNLFDVEYFENANSALDVFYGQPFTLQGTISWQF